jgi:hypothetical protein
MILSAGERIFSLTGYDRKELRIAWLIETAILTHIFRMVDPLHFVRVPEVTGPITPAPCLGTLFRPGPKVTARCLGTPFRYSDIASFPNLCDRLH